MTLPQDPQLVLEDLLFPHPNPTHQSPKDLQSTQEKYPPLLHPPTPQHPNSSER